MFFSLEWTIKIFTMNTSIVLKNVQVKRTTSSKSAKEPKEAKVQPNVSVENKETKTSLLDFLKFGESYTSLILGIIVVIVATVLLLSFVKTRGTNKGTAQN